MGAPAVGSYGILCVAVLFLAGRQAQTEHELAQQIQLNDSSRRLAAAEAAGDGVERSADGTVTRAHLERELARLQEALGSDVASIRNEMHELRAGLQELRRDAADLSRRRAQGAEPEPEPEPAFGGENVKIIKQSVVRCGGPGSTTVGAVGTFDYSQCVDRAFASCHADACAGHSGGAGHRRAQAGATCVDLPTRTAQVTAACCDQPGEDCSGGYPHTCDAGCSSVFLAFWVDCRSSLGRNSAQFEPAVALCEATSLTTTKMSLAEQLNVHCSDGTAAADCVPECSEAYHGYLLLLNIEGEDSKLSCELRHGRYSWVGPAADGGFLGSDVESFVSAIVSGAAGVFFGLLLEDADISTPLVITPGQTVSVSGDRSLMAAPRWGSGGFTVEERGSLSVSYTTMQSDLTVLGGGTSSFNGCTLGALASLTVHNGGSLSLISTAMPFSVLVSAQAQLSGAGSTLHLSAVTLSDQPGWGALTGAATILADGSKTIEPPEWGVATSASFIVTSGPCTVSDGGRCVGRPGGYLGRMQGRMEEACTIVAGGGGGMLGACGVFDLGPFDFVILPDGLNRGDSNCPDGEVLAAGDTVRWETDGNNQGSLGRTANPASCIAKGTCGLPYSHEGIGGGWQICFAASGHDTASEPAPAPAPTTAGSCAYNEAEMDIGAGYCARAIASGQFTCSVDYSPTGAYQHACDHECGFPCRSSPSGGGGGYGSG